MARAKELGVKQRVYNKGCRPFIKLEDDIIAKHCPAFGVDKAICDKLKRSKRTIEYRAKKLEVKMLVKRRPFAVFEIDVIRAYFPRHGADATLRKWLCRGKTAIYCAAKSHGITRADASCQKQKAK